MPTINFAAAMGEPSWKPIGIEVPAEYGQDEDGLREWMRDLALDASYMEKIRNGGQVSTSHFRGRDASEADRQWRAGMLKVATGLKMGKGTPGLAYRDHAAMERQLRAAFPSSFSMQWESLAECKQETPDSGQVVNGIMGRALPVVDGKVAKLGNESAFMPAMAENAEGAVNDPSAVAMGEAPR